MKYSERQLLVVEVCCQFASQLWIHRIEIGAAAGIVGAEPTWLSGWRVKINDMNPRPRTAIATALVFIGFGVVCGIAGAVALWWFASQPLDVYTAGYEPLAVESIRINSSSPFGYMAVSVLGGGVLGALVGALVHYAGWGLMRRAS